MYFFGINIKIHVTYYKSSLVIVLKELKCMCMSYIIINPWPSLIEIYEYFNEFINFCTFIGAWCIFVFIRHKIWNIWRLWSWLVISQCWHKEILFKACIITWKLRKFFNWKINYIQVTTFFSSIHFYMYFSIHIKKNQVGEELTKTKFLLFGCMIMLYMLTHVL
jgi:hypothetical protein